MQQGLLSALNPSDALPAPRYTGMLLPIERDMYGNKGNFELAVPQFLQDAYSGINKFGQVFRGELSPQEIQKLAFDTSMNVTGGSLLGSRLLPNAVPSGGILGMGVSKTPNQTGLLGKTNKVTPETGLLGKVDNVQPKSGIAEVVPPTDKADGIMAFHGSPYDFNQFSLSKINTGEGNQAFGYGLYFTDSKDIAKFYRNSLSDDVTSDTRFSYKGKEYERGSPEWKMLSTIYNEGKSSAKKLLDVFKSDLAKGEPYITSEKVKRYESIFNQSPKKSEISKNQGRIYEVNIKTITDDLLNYDKPLGQQSGNIKNILNKMKSEVNLDDARNLGFDPFDYGGNEKRAVEEAKKVLFGKDEDVVRFLNNWAVIRGNQATGEKLLAKYGAKGIVYKADQGVGARNVPETGKNNYVIFDDKIIDIMKKYGIVGAVGVTAMQGRGNQSPEADLSS